jgi:hypothetical protein
VCCASEPGQVEAQKCREKSASSRLSVHTHLWICLHGCARYLAGVISRNIQEGASSHTSREMEAMAVILTVFKDRVTCIQGSCFLPSLMDLD